MNKSSRLAALRADVLFVAACLAVGIAFIAFSFYSAPQQPRTEVSQ
jgi:hypothetical protein